MSGIAGLLHFSRRLIQRREIERMANALRSYGPDRSDVLIADCIGLVHVLMRMTPEDRFDCQPIRGLSGAIITADLRLDNRDDILALLAVDRREAATWSDAMVLLVAWEKFGDQIWSKLCGPFAVAIWDPRCKTLTLTRDHLGLNVVMWHKCERFFAFATMPKGLFALEDVPFEFSEEKLADFLVLNHADHATTFYRNVFRLPPAHLIKVTADGSMERRRYWSPADVKTIRLSSDQAYAEGLRECLDRSVRRQMRSAHPIASELTGGLDSSSVSVLAARALGERNARLAAFTHVPRVGFDGPTADGCYTDETCYVEEIRRFAGNIDITYVRNDASDDFSDLERFFLAMEAPIRNPTTFGWMLAVLRSAHAQGRRVLLGGFFGNYTISWDGWSQVIDHLLAGRLTTAYRQWHLFYRRSPYSRWATFRRLVVEPLLPSKIIGRSIRGHKVERWRKHSAIRSDFAAAMGVEARARIAGHDFNYRLQSNERSKGLWSVDYIGDWFAAEKAVTGVESRDPTADMDVISFCFGIPSEQYLTEGIDRSLIRRAMWGFLPESVLTNRSSGLQSADWYERLDRRREQFAAELAEFSASPLTSRSIDLARLADAIKNWPTGAWDAPSIVDEYQLAFTRGMTTARFLRWVESKNR